MDTMEPTTTTDTQASVKRTKDGKFDKGGKPVAGFNAHPENQSPGGWKKENTISYQYNRFMNMGRIELLAWDKLPAEGKTVAMEIAYRRVVASFKSLADVKEITDRTEGKSKEFIDLTSDGDKIQFGNMVPRNADAPST